MAKIETLTPAQWQQMRDYREQQRAEALRTDRIDQVAAKAAIAGLYRAAGLDVPRLVLIFDSPMQCLMARGLLRLNNKDQLRDLLRCQLWDLLRDQLRGQLREQLREQLRDQLREQLRDQLRGQLWDQLGDQLWGRLGDQLREQLRCQLRCQLWDQLNDDLYQWPYFIGGWDRYWLALYAFAQRIGVGYSAKVAAHFEAYRTYADTCGVAFLYPGVALVSDRPERIVFDSARRLHADDGPALKYRDGCAVHAWRGVRVEAKWIEDRHELTADQVMGEQNAELRRVLMEIYAHVHGADRIIADLNAELLAEDVSHGRPRKLYAIKGERFLHVINGSLEPDGTRREFMLGASPDASTPHEAVAASYGRPARHYREAVRT